MADGKIVIDVILEDGQVAKGVADIDKQLGGVADSGEKAAIGIGKLVKSLAGIAAAVGVFKVLRDAVGAAFDRIDTMEQFERVMTTMTGSSEKANAVLDDTNDIVTGTSYGLDIAAKAVQGFVTSNMDVDKATDSVASWGDAVSFYGDGSNETFNTVTTALAQMVAKGKVQMDTMNRLTEAGIPAMQIFADATGQSVEEVADQMQKGELAADEFIDVMNDALVNGTDSFAGIEGAAKDAGASWQGSWANMRAAAARGVIAIIESIDQLLSDNGLPTMREMIANFGSFLETTLNAAATVIEVFGNALFALIGYIEPLMPAVVGITSALATFFALQWATAAASAFTLAGALTFLKGAMETVALASLYTWDILKRHPIIAIISAIVGLAAAVIYLWNTNEDFRNFFINAWESIKSAIESVAPFLQRLGGHISDIASLVYDASLDAFSAAIEWTGNAASVAGQYLSDLALATSELLGNMATSAIDAFNSAIEWLGDTARTIIDYFIDLKDAIDIKSVLGNIISPLATVVSLIFGLASPIGWAIKGFVMLTTQTSLFSDVLSVFKGEMSIGELVNNFAGDLSNMITSLAENAAIFIEKGSEMAIGFIESFSEMLPDLIDSGVEIITNLIEGITTAIPFLVETGLMILTTLLETIIELIPVILEVGITIITTLIEGLTVAIPILIETWIMIFTTLLETVVEMIPIILEIGITIITTLIEAFVTALPMLLETWLMIFTTLLEAVVEFLPLVIETITMLVQTIIETFVEMLPLLTETFLMIVMTLIETLLDALPMLIEVILTLVMTIADTLLVNLPLIIDAGIQILMALIDGILTLLPVLIETALNLVVSILDAIITNLPLIIDAGIQVLMALIEGIISILPQLISAGIDVILALVQAIIGLLPELINAGIQLLTALIDGIISVLPQLISAGIDLILQLVQAIISLLPELLNAGVQLLTALVEGIVSVLPQLISAGIDLIIQLVQAIIGLLPELLNAGVELITSLISGITQMAGEVLSAGIDLITGMIDGILGKGAEVYNAATDILGQGIDGITSMAGQFLEAGGNIVGSIADGIKGAVGKVTGAMSDLVKKAREYLPFSPAKKGAFRDIMYPGITNSLAKNINRGSSKPLKEMRGLTNSLSDEMHPKVTNRLRGASVDLGRVSTQVTASQAISAKSPESNAGLANLLTEQNSILNRLLNKDNNTYLDSEKITNAVNENNAILASLSKF